MDESAEGAADIGRRPSLRAEWPFVAALAAWSAVAAIAVQALRDVPVIDDWTYAWSVERLLQHGELRVLDWSAVIPLGHALWGALWSWVLGFSFGTLRLADRARLQLASSYVPIAAAEAVDLIHSLVGTAGIRNDHVFQRHFRDVTRGYATRVRQREPYGSGRSDQLRPGAELGVPALLRILRIAMAGSGRRTVVLRTIATTCVFGLLASPTAMAGQSRGRRSRRRHCQARVGAVAAGQSRRERHHEQSRNVLECHCPSSFLGSGNGPRKRQPGSLVAAHAKSPPHEGIAIRPIASDGETI